jgi:hypothetical protein
LYPRPGTTLLSDTPAPTPCPRSAAIVAARLPTPTLKRQASSAGGQLPRSVPVQITDMPTGTSSAGSCAGSLVPSYLVRRSLAPLAPALPLPSLSPMCCSVSPLIANHAIDQRTPLLPARP